MSFAFQCAVLAAFADRSISTAERRLRPEFSGLSALWPTIPTKMSRLYFCDVLNEVAQRFQPQALVIQLRYSLSPVGALFCS